ncbi:MAG: GumC family protein [Panacagrimonas sp.]
MNPQPLHERPYPVPAEPLQDVASILFLRMRSIVLVFLGVVGIAAFVVFYVLTPTYEASSTLLINSGELIVPMVEGVPPSEFEKQAALHTQKAVLGSTKVAEKVVDKLKLDQRRVLSRIEKAKIWVRDQRRPFGKVLGIASWQQAEDYRARALNALVANLKIEGKSDNQAINLSYSAHDPIEAADTVNAVVEVYQDYFNHQHKERAERRISDLETQLTELNQELARTEREMLKFRRSDRIALGASQSSFSRDPGDVPDASEVAVARQSGLVGITDSPAVQTDIKLRVLSMQEDLRKLRTEFGERAPAVVDLREKIRAYTEAIDKLPEREVDLVRLRRNLEINQDAAITLKRLVEKAKAAAATGARNNTVINVLDRAEPDGRAASPKRQLAMTVATIFGLALGVIVALIRHYFDHSLRTTRDLESYLGVKVLGSLQVVR